MQNSLNSYYIVDIYHDHLLGEKILRLDLSIIYSAKLNMLVVDRRKKRNLVWHPLKICVA